MSELSTYEINTLIEMFLDLAEANRSMSCPVNISDARCLTIFKKDDERASCVKCWKIAARRKANG